MLLQGKALLASCLQTARTSLDVSIAQDNNQCAQVIRAMQAPPCTNQSQAHGRTKTRDSCPMREPHADLITGYTTHHARWRSTPLAVLHMQLSFCTCLCISGSHHARVQTLQQRKELGNQRSTAKLSRQNTCTMKPRNLAASKASQPLLGSRESFTSSCRAVVTPEHFVMQW